MRSGAKLSAWCAPLLGVLTGCATYERAPLPQHADLAPSVLVPVDALAMADSPRPVIDPAAPLDEATVAVLAVLNNPDLRAERLKAGVAGAQVFEAGLLPDPQVAVGLSRSSAHRGYDAALTEEVQSILTRNARRSAARARSRQVNLEILWQESQVAEKARELFIQLSAAPTLRQLLSSSRDALARRYERDRSAMRQNAATVTTVAADAAALDDVDAQLRDLALQRNDADHALHALLGLQPGAPIRLGPIDPPVIPTRNEFDRAAATLPGRRADLLALQAGYQSQEESVRAAVLGQFPAISVGIDQARSAEEGVRTSGLSVTVSLPVFNRNRGRIAIERATREQLRQAYQARLDQAVNDADRVWASIRLLNRQYQRLQRQAADAKNAADAADREFKAGILTLDKYAALRPEQCAQEIRAMRARIAVAQAEAAFDLISGTQLSPVRRPAVPPEIASRGRGPNH